jgi:uncharacterized protein YkwD
VNAAGYSWNWIGENIHASVSLPQLVPSWMASAPHRENILADHFRDVGFGCSTDRGGGPWYSLIFGLGS